MADLQSKIDGVVEDQVKDQREQLQIELETTRRNLETESQKELRKQKEIMQIEFEF